MRGVCICLTHARDVDPTAAVNEIQIDRHGQPGLGARRVWHIQPRRPYHVIYFVKLFVIVLLICSRFMLTHFWKASSPDCISTSIEILLPFHVAISEICLSRDGRSSTVGQPVGDR